MAYSKSEPPKETNMSVPSFGAEVGTRLRVIEKLFPNRATAAKAASVGKSTLQSWIEGRAKPSFEGIAALAKATGVSLDWLATGDGPMYMADIPAATAAPQAQTAGEYPPFISTVVKSKIIGAMFAIEQSGDIPPLKVFADRVVEMYLEDYHAYASGERELPKEVSFEVIESMRPSKNVTTKAS